MYLGGGFIGGENVKINENPIIIKLRVPRIIFYVIVYLQCAEPNGTVQCKNSNLEVKKKLFVNKISLNL